MMEALALPLRLEQPEKWPFDLIVTDALGVELINERRYAQSTADQTVAEAVECVHFRYAEREAAAAANRAQIARLKAIVRAVNSHDQMLAALKALRDECSAVDHPWPVLTDLLTDATEAIAAAEGRS
jgi:hypothetical protein